MSEDNSNYISEEQKTMWEMVKNYFDRTTGDLKKDITGIKETIVEMKDNINRTTGDLKKDITGIKKNIIGIKDNINRTTGDLKKDITGMKKNIIGIKDNINRIEVNHLSHMEVYMSQICDKININYVNPKKRKPKKLSETSD